MKNVKISILLVLCVSITFMAFKRISPGNKPIAPDLSQQLIGEWRNVYLKIVTHHKDKISVTVNADSTNWEANLGIKPIRTHFMAGGTYYSEYFNLKDSLVRHTEGTWSVKGDSLTMTQLKPDKSSYTLQTKVNGDHAFFNGLVDFDGEGINNDEYTGIQKKF